MPSQERINFYFSQSLTYYQNIIIKKKQFSYTLSLLPVPAKSPSKPTEPAWSPAATQTTPDAASARLVALRARRRVRRRIYLQRRPLGVPSAAAVPDSAARDRQLAVRHARKLVSQLTHRRYVHHRWKSGIMGVVRKRRDGEKKMDAGTKDNSKVNGGLG